MIYFKKSIFFLVLVLFSSACTSSKVFTKIKCHECLDQDVGILLLPLAWDASFQTLSVAEKNALERKILEIFEKKNFNNVELYDNLDYELLTNGIGNLNDSTERSKLDSQLGYTYLLGLSLGETSDSDGWDYQDEQEQNALYPVYREPLEVEATLRFALIKIETGVIVSDHTILTSIGEVPIPDEDGGTNFWNFGTISGTINAAVKKGIKFTVKDCECNGSSKPEL